MNYKFLISCVFLLIVSCYKVNKDTSEIANLNTDCLNKNAWVDIVNKYSPDRAKKIDFIDTYNYFQKLPVSTDILYLENPDELIAVSKDHYSIRYIYSPKVSANILKGSSSVLSIAERKRVRNRILNIIIEYQCDKGKDISKKMMESEI